MTIELTYVDMHYIVYAYDEAGNEVVSKQRTLEVDGTLPTITEDLSDTEAMLGTKVMLKVVADDNLGVEAVEALVFWGSEDLVYNMSGGGTYVVTIEVPRRVIGDATYRIRVTDVGGNLAETEMTTTHPSSCSSPTGR